MKIDVTTILVLAFLPLVVRTFLYLVALKIRSIRISLTGCIVVAGAPNLILLIPLPLPPLFASSGAILIAMFLLSRYTEAELFPDIIVIPIAVEIVSVILLGLLFIPLVK